MDRRIELTADGSHTVFDMRSGERFHSTGGAISESMHVFIKAGLLEVMKNHSVINILEVGFGTGLNALLSCLYNHIGVQVFYHALEKYPLDDELLLQLNYPEMLDNPNARTLLNAMHRAEWGKETAIAENFTLLKSQTDLIDCTLSNSTYHLVYFDAFSPASQPELWSDEVFAKLYDALLPGGLLTTYSSSGLVKRAMRSAGFTVKRLPGPAGKRHMLRGVKPLE